MLAKDLIKILELNPDAEVFSVHTQYNGGEDESTIEPALSLTNGDYFIITVDDFHDKAEAMFFLSTLDVTDRQIYDKADKKTDDLCIYID